MGVVMVADLWVWRDVTGVVFFLPRPMSEGLTGRSSTSEKRVDIVHIFKHDAARRSL